MNSIVRAVSIETEVTSGDFRKAMRQLTGGVSVVTAGRGRDISGMTVTSVSSLSASAPWAVARAITSRATQVGACTPLVIEPMGTSASSKAGHSPLNIPRLTSP